MPITGAGASFSGWEIELWIERDLQQTSHVKGRSSTASMVILHVTDPSSTASMVMLHVTDPRNDVCGGNGLGLQKSKGGVSLLARRLQRRSAKLQVVLTQLLGASRDDGVEDNTDLP